MSDILQFGRVPLTIQLSNDDTDIIEWLQGLERGSKGREVKAAIRARIASRQLLDGEFANLGEQIRRLGIIVESFQHLQDVKFQEIEPPKVDTTELAPELVKNLAGNFRPGRTRSEK